MPLDIKTVEAILRQHWQIPSEVSSGALHDYAGRIQVLIGQKYSHDNLKYQLGLMQTKKLKQPLDEEACNRIASDLLSAANPKH